MSYEETDFKTTPYAHQLEALNLSDGREYFAYLMDMGTGKTKVVIDRAAKMWTQGKISALVVIAPNNVHARWVTEQLPAHCSVPYRAFVWRSAKMAGKRYSRWFSEFVGLSGPFLKVFAINVEAFQSDSIIPFVAEFVRSQECFIVVDEATRIKNPNAKRSKTIHKLNKYGTRAILTGTPTAKSPFDLWSMFEFLKPNYFGCNYFMFQHRYGVLMKGVNQDSGKKYTTLIDEKTYRIARHHLDRIKESRGGTLMPDDFEEVAGITGLSEANVRFIAEHPTFTRFKRLDELKQIIAKDSYSILKTQCLDLPPKVYEIIDVTMTEEQAKVYKSLQRELWAEYGDKHLDVANKAALTTRLMQVSGGFFPYVSTETHYGPGYSYEVPVGRAVQIGATNAKIEALLADMEEAGDQQIIVWAAFVAEIKAIMAALEKAGKSCCAFYGGISQKDRAKNVDDFIAGKYDVFVGNTATAGLGLNLQCASLQYFFSNTFKTEDRLQGEDRSHRIGMKSTAVYKDLVMKGTIDRLVLANLREGRELNDYFRTASLKDLLKTEEEEEDVVF